MLTHLTRGADLYYSTSLIGLAINWISNEYCECRVLPGGIQVPAELAHNLAVWCARNADKDAREVLFTYHTTQECVLSVLVLCNDGYCQVWSGNDLPDVLHEISDTYKPHDGVKCEVL